MPLVSYFFVAGSALVAALFLASAHLPPVDAPFRERPDVAAFLKYKAHVGHVLDEPSAMTELTASRATAPGS